MNFSEWTKNKKRKNQQVDLQETTREPSAAPAAKASSFAEWTKGQTAAKSENAGQSRNAGPQPFSEWIRQNRGDSAWREEDVAVRQRNDYISDYTKRANREFTAQRNRYVAPETAAQRQTEATSQAKAARNAGTEILEAMRQSGRYSDEETRQALERLTAGNDVMEAVRKNAENDTAFRSQFQTEDQYNSWKKWQEYENLRNNPDFAEKSKYKSTANNSKPSVIDILADNYRADNSGWDDPLYEYVNGNQEAGAYLYNRANSVYGSGGNALGALYGNVADSKTEAVQMTDDERALFNYIYATQGKDSAHEYYEAIQSGLNARQREQDMRALQEYASERPVEASFLSVLESPLKGLSYIGQASDYLSGGSIDQNAGYNRFAYYGSSIRGKVSDTIANSGKWGKVGSFLYQTGMSMGDFLLNTALTGGFGVDAAATPALAKGVEALSLAIMGTGAAADATIEAKDRGLTDTQAFTLGTIAGAAEIVTEKVSIEALLDKTTLGRDAVGYLLKNTLAEGSEEVASDLINLIADILVTKDKSQWHEAIQGYEAQGLSEKDAWWRAVLDQAEEMGVDFLGGALSGGVMAGTGIAINSGVNDYYARQNGRMILDADAVQDTIDSGLTMGENTRAYQQARDLMARVSEGQDVSALQIGRLYGENVQALEAETKAGDLLLQAAREAAEHGTISNNRALDILDSPAALDTLISETGVDIREDMTRAQRRRAVKSAVEALASETTGISVSDGEPVTVNTESRQEAATAPVQAATENRNPALQVFDGKQIAEAGKALGENGRKALTSTYAKASDSMSGADYYEAFSQYYQAGVTGKDMAEVNPQVEISPAQQFAAYVSGQNDAAASAAREKTAAKYAKTAGDGSGLVYDTFVKEAVESGRTLENSRSAYLTAETAEQINDVAKALGLRAQFVDSVEGGLANAQIQGDTVLIERNNPNPVMFLTGHEITHRIQELAPEQYRSFRQFVSENDADFQAQVEAIQSLYESHGMEISYEKAMDEAAADYAGRLMEDGTLLDEFIQKNRKDKTLLEKVRDAIRAIIDVLTGREKQQAQTAEGKLTAALEAAAREAETISQRTENAAQEGEKNTAMSGGKKYSVARRYEDVDLSKDGRVYTYDFLTSLPDMKVVTLPEIGSLRGSDNRIDTGAVVRIGMENARAVGTVQDGKTYVQNRYTGHNLRIDNSSVRHGLNGGQNRLLTNSRLGAVIGDVVKNAVPINALHNKADGVIGTYAMAGYAVDSAGREFVSIVTVEQRSGEITGVESYDVTHAVSGRQKNSSQADTKSQGVYPIKAANTSIDSLIQNVNSTHQSILSDDVLKHLGETRNPNGDYTNRVKFSLKGTAIDKKYADLVKENRMLRERLDYWKGQTKLTKEVSIDKKSVERAAKGLVKTYESDMELSDVQGRLQSLYDYIARGYDGKDATYKEARRRAEALATDLIDNAVSRDTDMYDQYSDLRQYLRDTKIVYGSEYKGDIPDFNDFRKRNFGRMRLSTEGKTNIDQVYQEMGSLWPEFFDEEAQAHPTDQLLRIDEVLSQLYEIHEGNPYSQYRTEAITDATNEIMETFFDLPQAKPTFADKQAAKIAELRAQNRQNVKDAILAERMAAGEEIAKLKRQYSEKSRRTRESQTARELRGRIIRHANSLSQKLLRPTDTQHIPENLRGAVAKLLSSINQERASGARSFTVDPVTKERVYAPKGTPTKRTEAFRELKEQYARIVAEGGDVVVDPSLFGDAGEGIKGGFDAVIAMGDEKLADMSAAQLKTVWQVLKAVEHSVTNSGKMLSATKYESTQKWADAFAKDASARRPRSQRFRNLGLSLETPYTYFSQYGETGKALYRALRNAQDQQQIIVSHVAEDVQKVVDSKTVKALEKSYQTYSLANGNLTLTTAQVMDLYNLSRREQAKNHILNGGIVQPEVKSAKIGRGTEIIRITEGDLGKILSSLTPEQKKIADGLQRISSTTLADYGNEASMTAYGYKKFTEPNYWPIRSAKEALHSNAEKSQANTRSVKNIGMAKPVIPNANTAVELDSVFRVFADHAADMTDYAAWLCTMEDVNRLFNYKYRDSQGNMTGQTMKSILDRVGGKGSQAYWSKLMNDIQNGINTKDFEPLTDLFSKGIGSFKGAAVGGNVRVIIQQPTAFFRAAAVMNPVDMAKGLATGVTKGNGWKKALQYSAIAMRKNTGGFDISSPYRMSETLFDTRSNVRKLNDTLSAAAAKADAVTWGALWNACEWRTLRENPNITKGSDAFYQRTAEHFAEMIDQTQVVDGVLQRSNVMRAKSEIGKQASSFMGEPIMSLNLLVRAYDQLRYTQDKKQRGKAIKTLGRSVTALVVTNAVNALAQSLVDAIRDDDPDKDYWERFWSAFTGISGDEESAWQKIWNSVMEGNFGGNMNMVAQVPYLKDALSLIQGYDVSRMDTEVMADVIQSAQAVIQNIDGSGKKTPGYALKELFAACAKVFGIPLANLSRDTWGAFRSVAADTGNIPMQYEMEKAIYNITNDSNKSRFLDILYRALEQGDMDSFEHIRKDLMERMGVDGKAIDSGLRSRYEKAAEKDPGYSLPEAARDLIGSRDPLYESPDVDTFGPEDLDNASYRSYAEQRASGYREMADNLETNPIFIGMDAESQENVMKAAYNLAEKTALEGNSNGQYEISSKWMQLADDAEEEGIEPWEYVLFHVAYSEMEGTKDKDGKTVKGESKGDHVREWLEDYDDFTESQRRFLWGTVYKSEW